MTTVTATAPTSRLPQAPEAPTASASRTSTKVIAGLFLGACLLRIGISMRDSGGSFLEYDPLVFGAIAGLAVVLAGLALPNPAQRLVVGCAGVILAISEPMGSSYLWAQAAILATSFALISSLLLELVSSGARRSDFAKGLQVAAVVAAGYAGLDYVYDLWLYGGVAQDLVVTAVRVALALVIMWQAVRAGQREMLLLGLAAAGVSAALHFWTQTMVADDLVLYLALVALLLSLPISGSATVSIGQDGDGTIGAAWADCRRGLSAKWADLGAYGVVCGAILGFGVLASVIGVFALLALMLGAATSDGNGGGEGWMLGLLVAVSALPILAGLFLGGIQFVMDQAIAASLVDDDGRLNAQGFVSRLRAQPGTAGLLWLGYTVSFLICAIPGLFIVVRWGFAMLPTGPNRSATEAVKASWHLTAGPRGWTVLGYQLLSNVASLVALFVGYLLALAAQFLWGAPWVTAFSILVPWGTVMVLSALARASLFRQFLRVDQRLT